MSREEKEKGLRVGFPAKTGGNTEKRKGKDVNHRVVKTKKVGINHGLITIRNFPDWKDIRTGWLI